MKQVFISYRRADAGELADEVAEASVCDAFLARLPASSRIVYPKSYDFLDAVAMKRVPR